jgi:HEAT repeat protein
LAEEVQDLIQQLLAGDETQAEEVVSQLAQQPEQAVEALLKALGERGGAEPQQVDQRWWLLRALAEIPDRRVPPVLIAALEEGEPGVRQCAALGLRKQPDPAAIPTLIALLEDSDHLTAALAADALTVIGEPAVPDLIQVLEAGSDAARLEAVRALANIGDKRSIPALVKVLDERSAILEYWAVEGLERMGVGMTFFKP